MLASGLFVLLGCSRHAGSHNQATIVGDTLTKHAKWLTLVERGDTVFADIRSPWRKDAQPTRLVFPGDTAIGSAVVYSSVYAGALKMLGSLDVVTGVADAQYFKIPEITRGLSSGKIVDVGNSQNPSVEAIINLKPDALIVSPYQDSDFGALRRLGVSVIEMMDYMEESPLGRAEWIKLLGLIVGKRQKADSIFNSVAQNYNALRETAAKTKSRPTVLSEIPYAGVWYVPGGKSYMARLFKDAGANYPWADTDEVGSLPLNFEAVFSKAYKADVWLVKSLGKESLKRLRTDNPLLQRFKAFAPARVWSVDTENTDFFESFPFHPDYLLQDYIAIFHPETGMAPRWFAPLME